MAQMADPADFLDEFLASLKDAGRSPWTVTLYRYQAQEFLAWTERQGKTPASLTSDDLRAYLRQFPGVSNRHAHLAMLRSLYRHLHSRSMVSANPTKALRYPPTAERPPRVVTPQEEQAIFAAVEGDLEAQVLLELLRYSGIRIGGIVGHRWRVYDPYQKRRVAHVTPGLRVGDVDLAQGTATITLKGGGTRQALLTERTALLLGAFIEQLAHRHSEAPVFQRSDGTPKGDRWAERTFRALIERAGLSRRVTPHMLRHTFATRFLEKGGDVRALQRLLHHRRLDSTLIYADFVDPQALREQFNQFVRPNGAGSTSQNGHLDTPQAITEGVSSPEDQAFFRAFMQVPKIPKPQRETFYRAVDAALAGRREPHSPTEIANVARQVLKHFRAAGGPSTVRLLDGTALVMDEWLFADYLRAQTDEVRQTKVRTLEDIANKVRQREEMGTPPRHHWAGFTRGAQRPLGASEMAGD